MRKAQILIVEDNDDDAYMLLHVLKGLPLHTHVEKTYEGAKAYLTKKRVELSLVDLHLKGMDGIALTAWIKARWPEQLVMIVSGTDDPATRLKAHAVGADFFFKKNFSAEDKFPLMALVSTNQAAFSRGRSLAFNWRTTVTGVIAILAVGLSVYKRWVEVGDMSPSSLILSLAVAITGLGLIAAKDGVSSKTVMENVVARLVTPPTKERE